MVRTFGQRLSEILFVKRLHIGVFMRETKEHLVIKSPQDISARLGALLAVVNRPPPAQPPGQAMTSTKSYCTWPEAIASMSFLVLPSPLTTAVRTVPAPGTSKLASFQPCIPRTAVKASGSGFSPVTR